MGEEGLIVKRHGAMTRGAGAEAQLKNYVRENLPRTIRPGKSSKMALPKPYSMPCVKEDFLFFFYWDTYFSNLGFYEIGMAEQSGNNLENIMALIQRFGYMPNADALTDRSQPPLFSRAVDDYVERTGSREAMEKFLPAMVREHAFWMRERLSPCGLNRYLGTPAGEDSLRDFHRSVRGRVGREEEGVSGSGEDWKAARELLAAAESGWDFSSRFTERGEWITTRLCPVDLNAILYDAERTIARFYRKLGRSGAEDYEALAESRRQNMRRLMRGKDGLYRDYDFVAERRTEILSAAALTPWTFGVEGPESAEFFSAALRRLETPSGILTSETLPGRPRYQWDAPQMWPPVLYFAAVGAENAGLPGSAVRLWNKYSQTVERVFLETGKLWEKYDAASGTVGGGVEYETPPMMGWSAGVYLYAKQRLKQFEIAGPSGPDQNQTEEKE